MRVAIYGAGAMGTILGVYLTKAGVDVVLVNRNQEHVKVLNEVGAKVIGEIEIAQKVNAITPEEMKGNYDIIFLMTKQTENSIIAKFLKDKLGSKGIVCTLQNGLPELKLMDILGEDKVIGCTAVWGATLEAPGITRLTSNPNNMSFQIGSLASNNKENLYIVQEILGKMCRTYIEDNFLGARWSKLIINAAFSGLSTILGVTFGEVAKNRRTREVAQRIIKETIDVAKNAGITIMPVQGKDIVKLMDYNNAIKKVLANLIIPIAMNNHKDIRSGMLWDIEKGRKTEVDAINGVVCEFGKKYDISTPFNDRIVMVVHRIELKELLPSPENIEIFDDLL